MILLSRNKKSITVFNGLIAAFGSSIGDYCRETNGNNINDYSTKISLFSNHVSAMRRKRSVRNMIMTRVGSVRKYIGSENKTQVKEMRDRVKELEKKRAQLKAEKEKKTAEVAATTAFLLSQSKKKLDKKKQEAKLKGAASPEMLARRHGPAAKRALAKTKVARQTSAFIFLADKDRKKRAQEATLRDSVQRKEDQVQNVRKSCSAMLNNDRDRSIKYKKQEVLQRYHIQHKTPKQQELQVFQKELRQKKMR